jgi:hypothetical protein
VQFGQYDFGRRNLFSRMDVNRNAATVIDHRDAIIDVNGDLNRVAMADKRFIDRVIDDFVDEMM